MPAGSPKGSTTSESVPVAAPARRFGVHVPAQGVALMAGRRVAEENRDRRFAGAGLQEPQRRQPQETPLEGELELSQAQCAALVAAGRKHDLLAGILLSDQPRLDARGGIGIEPDRKRTGLQPRALRVQHDDGRKVLVREAQRVAAKLHLRARRQTLLGPAALKLEAIAERA